MKNVDSVTFKEIISTEEMTTVVQISLARSDQI